MSSSRGGSLVGVRVRDRWTIEARIGQGGMGTVWRAVDDDGQVVAIKTLRRELVNSENIFIRFRQEARAASTLGNPHIVKALDFGMTVDGRPFYTMEFCDGRDLLEEIESEGRLPWPRAFAIAEQICAALHDAHRHGLIHRDVKPENFILVEREPEHGQDYVKVLDFGIAKLIDPGDDAIQTHTGVTVGTPEYMAPEQGEGLELDARVDIYALGVLLYQMVCGEVPFSGRDEFEVVSRHMTESVVPPSRRAPDAGIPSMAEAVIMQALEKDREHRFTDMERFARSLKSARARPDKAAEASARSGSYGSTTSGAVAPAESKGGSLRWLWIALGFVALFVAGAAIVLAGS